MRKEGEEGEEGQQEGEGEGEEEEEEKTTRKERRFPLTFALTVPPTKRTHHFQQMSMLTTSYHYLFSKVEATS